MIREILLVIQSSAIITEYNVALSQQKLWADLKLVSKISQSQPFSNINNFFFLFLIS